MPFDCPPAAAAREHGPGHVVVYCEGGEELPVGVVPATVREAVSVGFIHR
jgi:hypothetical protein